MGLRLETAGLEDGDGWIGGWGLVGWRLGGGGLEMLMEGFRRQGKGWGVMEAGDWGPAVKALAHTSVGPGRGQLVELSDA